MTVKPHDLAVRAWRAMPDTFGRHLSMGTYKAPNHVKLISWLLLLNANGIIRRQGISLPPGSGKSELIDLYDSAWLLDHDPRRRIILTSYSGTLVEEQAKRVRNLIESNQDELSCRIMQDSRAADRWKTLAGGGMWSAGIGGSITGRRASTLKIDDPHKNLAEALSEKQQLDVWNWYTAAARTRMLPRASVQVIQTRWAEGDLVGRLKANDEGRDDWLFVALPAVAEENETIETILGPYWTAYLKYLNIELFPWFREQGEPLWPELEPGVPWFDLTELDEIRREIGEVAWAGLYQQRPAPMDGEMFKRDRWVRVDAMPPGQVTYVRRWDLASTEGGGDWTASCLMAYHHATKMPYIIEMRRERFSPDKVEAYVLATAIEDRDLYGKQVHIRVEREPGSSGKAVEAAYVKLLAGFDVEFLSSTGEKRVRGIPLSAQQGAGLVHLVRQPVGGEFVTPAWFEWLISEASVFPHGKHDDMVDVASLAYVDLLELAPRRSQARAMSAASRRLGIFDPTI